MKCREERSQVNTGSGRDRIWACPGCSAERLASPSKSPKIPEAMPPKLFQISRDSPAYYLTAVTKDRLPVFRTPAIAKLACEAIAEARRSGGFLIFAYVLMLDHLHLVTDNSIESKDVHRFVNGIISRRVIDHLKENGHEESLRKLRVEERSDGWKYSLWQHHPNTRLLWSE